MPRIAAALILCFLLGVLPQMAAAAPEGRERALELGREAIALHDEGRWAEALERLEQAERLVHSPVFVLWMARVRHKSGRLLAARSLYQRVIDEPVPVEAPDPWRDAQQDAVAELASLRPRIPSLRVQVPGAEPSQIRVRLDGVLLDPPPVETAVDVDPGEHQVAVTVGRQPPAQQTVTLREGQGEVIVEIDGPAAAAAPSTPSTAAAPAPTGAPTPLPPRRESSGKGLGTLGTVLMVGGGVLLAVWVGTGLAAMDAESELAGLCTDGVCAGEYEDKVDTYYALAHTATGTLIVGSVFFGAGLIMHLATPSEADEADEEQGDEQVVVRPYFGPGSVGVVGRF